MGDEIEDWNAATWAQQDNDERWIYEHTHAGEAMKVSDMITSKYLRKEDLEDDTPVTIKGIKLEDLGRDDAKEQRWVIYFKEFEKGMVLNVTSIRVLESAFGDDTDPWLGKRVLLYVDPSVSFQGRVVGGLRIRVPRPKATSEKVKKVSTLDDDLNAEDDSIPF